MAQCVDHHVLAIPYSPQYLLLAESDWCVFIALQDRVDFFLAIEVWAHSVLSCPAESRIAHGGLDVLFQIRLAVHCHVLQELHQILEVVSGVGLQDQVSLDRCLPLGGCLAEQLQHLLLRIRQLLVAQVLQNTRSLLTHSRQEVFDCNQWAQCFIPLPACSLSEMLCQ